MTDPIYDTHAHVFSSDIERYPVTPGTIRQTPEQVIERIKADPLPGEKLLGLFDEAGGIASEGTAKFLRGFAERFVAHIGKVKG